MSNSCGTLREPTPTQREQELKPQEFVKDQTSSCRCDVDQVDGKVNAPIGLGAIDEVEFFAH